MTGLAGSHRSVPPITLPRLTLPQKNESATPTLAFGDGDSGIYEESDDVIRISVAGALAYFINAVYFGSGTTSGAMLKQTGSSATVPGITFQGDNDTGIGKAAADTLSLIAGGTEVMRLIAGSATCAAISLTNCLTIAAPAHVGGFQDIFITSSYAQTGTGQQVSPVLIAPTYNQPSATSVKNTDLLINRTETNLGTTPGAQLFLDCQVAGTSQCKIRNDGVIFPKQAATASAPTYTLGGIYFDTTLNKLRVGGAAAWETITSA